MATQAHCAYCFESLSASLEKRAPLSLHQVQQLWKQYTSAPSDPVDPAAESASEIEDEHTAPLSTSTLDNRPAAISRLAAPSPSTASSSSIQSSASSTPSGISEASSATSKNSSRSSVLSSLGKRLRGEKDTIGSRDAQDGEGEASPLFVTWNTVDKHGEFRLRGCIGTFEAQELSDGLRSYALTSAFDDTRFSPITASELPSLNCGVTLLHTFEPVSDPMDWDIGTHGLRISFTHNGRRYGATYLPDVAKEQGWTKEETMVSLMRKAGWRGRSGEWRDVQGLGVVRYQGKQVKLGWEEYKEWREWVDEVDE